MSAAADTEIIVTPTVRKFIRRWLFWISLFVVALLIVIVTSFVSAGFAADKQQLGPDDASPGGAKALVQVLRSQGVTVTATTTLRETESAIRDPANTTLVLYDSNGFLNDSQLAELAGRAKSLVVIDPNFLELNTIAPGIALGGSVGETLDADCELPAVTKAGTVTGDGSGYRLITVDTSAKRCLGSGDKVFSLIQFRGDSGTVTVLGTTAALSNGYIADRGNAALALNLFGETRNLVWYIPSADDLVFDVPPTLSDLTPGWVIQVSLLLVITAIFAAFWRGRRMGPLIVENLPVTVRASETMQGRARLYANSSARLHALDSLRIGTVDRLAKACGLSTLATVKEVSDAAAAVTGRDPAAVHSLLFDAQPSSDRELVQLSDALLALEKSVATAIRPTL